MDTYANDLLINILQTVVRSVPLPQENENIVEIHDEFLVGKYVINMDPLDVHLISALM